MIQVGIRGPLYGAEDFAFHDQHGIEVVRIESGEGAGHRLGDGAASAPPARRPGLSARSTSTRSIRRSRPATGTPEVGGLTSYEALVLVRALVGPDARRRRRRRGLAPYDGPGQITALLAANLLFEIVSLLALQK